MIRLLIRLHIYGLHHCHFFDSALVYDRYQLPVIEFSCFHCLSDWRQKLFEINRLIKVNFLEINWLKKFLISTSPTINILNVRMMWSGETLYDSGAGTRWRGSSEEDLLRLHIGGCKEACCKRMHNIAINWEGRINRLTEVAIKTLFVCVSVFLIPGVVCVDIFGRQFTSKSS